MNDQTAQKGLFSDPFISAHYLEYKLNSNVNDPNIFSAIKQSLGCEADCYINVAFGSKAWDQLNPEWRPLELTSYTTLTGENGYMMPSNQTDIFFWIHGMDQGEVMNAVLYIQKNMQNIAKLKHDINGFKNKESRDLTGFVDGTENPKEDARFDAALIPEEKIGAGGSYVLTQKWQHNLQAFNELSIHDQEQVIGRTKIEDEELEGDDNPPTSHVSRTDAKVDGVAMKIYRRSTPYGNAGEHGLYFIAFACEMQRFTVQLQRMLGNTDDGYSDHLMNFSTAKTGAYWFMPSQKDLDNLLART